MDVDAAATISKLRAAMASGALTAAELTEHCVRSITGTGTALGAVIALHPDAARHAALADERWRAAAARPLEGIPVLVKDNVAVSGLPTTAGSRALAGSCPPDAPLVGRLRDAGAIVLGKTNLSEWANFRSEHSTSGWSAVGGQTHNPHVLDRNTSGSSSGSACAVAAGLAPVAIGTETDGSIVSPAGVCGVVGFKPTLGTVPGAGIVPISSAQDIAGPMTRHVADAALLYAVLAGTPADALSTHNLRGARIGVWQPAKADAASAGVLADAVTALTDAGAVAVPVDVDTAPIEEVEWPALLAEFHHEIDAHLAAAPGSAVRNLAQLIEFNLADDIELRHFGQELFEQALAAPPLTDRAYRAQRAAATTGARTLLDGLLGTHRLDAIVTLSNDPAWPIDYAAGDQYGISTATPAAVAGYPTISVPAGFVGDLPIGVSFLAGAGADARLLGLALAFEQATSARRPPRYLASAT